MPGSSEKHIPGASGVVSPWTRLIGSWTFHADAVAGAVRRAGQFVARPVAPAFIGRANGVIDASRRARPTLAAAIAMSCPRRIWSQTLRCSADGRRRRRKFGKCPTGSRGPRSRNRAGRRRPCWTTLRLFGCRAGKPLPRRAGPGRRHRPTPMCLVDASDHRVDVGRRSCPRGSGVPRQAQRREMSRGGLHQRQFGRRLDHPLRANDRVGADDFAQTAAAASGGPRIRSGWFPRMRSARRNAALPAGSPRRASTAPHPPARCEFRPGPTSISLIDGLSKKGVTTIGSPLRGDDDAGQPLAAATTGCRCNNRGSGRIRRARRRCHCAASRRAPSARRASARRCGSAAESGSAYASAAAAATHARAARSPMPRRARRRPEESDGPIDACIILRPSRTGRTVARS